jgi:hypothetical protein
MKIKYIISTLIMIAFTASSASAAELKSSSSNNVKMQNQQQTLEYRNDMYKKYKCQFFKNSFFNEDCKRFKMNNATFANPSDYNDIYK